MQENAGRQAPETKATTDAGVGPAFEEFMAAFEAFKEVNDARLGEIERRSAADPVTEEKLARIDRALDAQKERLDRITLKGARPALGGGAERTAGASSEHKQAFETYVRAGATDGLKAIEAKAMSIGSGADGGYLVPSEIETEINKRLAAISPIRGIATVRTVSSGTYKRPFMTAGPAVGWAAETASRSQTNAPTLAELSFPAAEIYAMPAATQALLDDAAVNIEQWIAEEVEAAFATQEGTAFVTGDGTNKPKGFLGYTNVAEGSWSWGSVGHLVTGAAGALPSTDASDVLIDLVYTLKGRYRQNATWVMNRKSQGAVRKLKDADGNYIWAPPATADSKASLMGFPVAESEDMPDIAANAYAIAFGDFRAGYVVVDRAGVSVLRDPYSAKPYVLFYTVKRVGGGIQDFDAIKLLKFAAS